MALSATTTVRTLFSDETPHQGRNKIELLRLGNPERIWELMEDWLPLLTTFPCFLYLPSSSLVLIYSSQTFVNPFAFFEKNKCHTAKFWSVHFVFMDYFYASIVCLVSAVCAILLQKSVFQLLLQTFWCKTLENIGGKCGKSEFSNQNYICEEKEN